MKKKKASKGEICLSTVTDLKASSRLEIVMYFYFIFHLLFE